MRRSARLSLALLALLALPFAACDCAGKLSGSGDDGGGPGMDGSGGGSDGSGHRDATFPDGGGCFGISCPSVGANCGPISDGCGGSIDCGTCTGTDTCGGGGVHSVCGTAHACVPTDCAAAGATCGPVGDGCGGMTASCGNCFPPETCGGAGVPSQCGVPTGAVDGGVCVPTTCAAAGATCGPIADGCGGLTAPCGTCTLPEICGGGGIPSVCGNSTHHGGPGTGCAPGVTTTISGVVTAPGHDDIAMWGAPDPVPNVEVYVPSGPVAPLPTGASCDRCTPPVSIVSTTTAVDGSFHLDGAPCGASVPLVIQIGLWRRQITIPTVACCVDNALTNAQTHLPRNHLEGEIPAIAVVTGSADPMECVLPKIGLDLGPAFGGAVNEFTDPSGTGAVHLYQGNGATISGATPAWTALYGSATELARHNLIIADCWGRAHDEAAYYTPPAMQNLIDYTTLGGRIYASHYEYSMLHGQNQTAPPAINAAWDPTAVWNVHQANPPDLTALVVTSFPKGLVFSQWLQLIGVSSTAAPASAQIPVQQVRHDFDAVNTCGAGPYTPATACTPPSQLWMFADPAASANTPLQYTFNTPVGAAPAAQCGRVMFSDFHVNTGGGGMGTFPGECMFPAVMTPQEKVLEFLLFDLTSCITPDIPMCTPLTCPPKPDGCGPMADGCGGSIASCGVCTPPDTCGGGGRPSICGHRTCAPLACPTTPGVCGPFADGCGGLNSCGVCTPPDTCGGGGTPSMCGHGSCTPSTCPTTPGTCGLFADGCGGSIDCGTCAAPDTCGGGGTPNVCGHFG